METKQGNTFIEHLYRIHKAEWEATPSYRQAVDWLSDLFEFLFPNNRLNKLSIYEGQLKKNQIDLENILLSYLDPSTINIDEVIYRFYASLEEIYQNLRLDATKTHDEDPAASSIHEVIVSYPGFYATAVYRIANRLSQLAVPILPRILSEHAHGETGGHTALPMWMYFMKEALNDIPETGFTSAEGSAVSAKGLPVKRKSAIGMGDYYPSNQAHKRSAAAVKKKPQKVRRRSDSGRDTTPRDGGVDSDEGGGYSPPPSREGGGKSVDPLF